MKAQIDESKKEIELIEPCTVQELFDFISSKFEGEWKNYKIVPHETFVDRVQYPIIQPYIPPNQTNTNLPYWPFQPFYTTCDSTTK